MAQAGFYRRISLGAIYVILTVEKVALGQVFLELFSFLLLVFFYESFTFIPICVFVYKKEKQEKIVKILKNLCCFGKKLRYLTLE
jgi:hypothetical protein